MALKRRRLARHRRSVGFTQESLADVLGVERSTVVRWEAGQTEPQPWMRLGLARVLRLSVEQLADLLAEANHPGSGIEDAVASHQRAFDGLTAMSPSLSTRSFEPTGVRVTGELAADLRTVSAGYRRAYRAAPAHQLYSAVHEHMRLALSLRPGDQAAPARTQLLITVGEMAAVAATILGLDRGRWSDARTYLDLADRAAREASHAELDAVVLAGRAFLAAYGAGDKRLGREFAEAAVLASRQGACNSTRGWVAAVAAERQADLNDAMASHRSHDRARAALSADQDERPSSGIGSFDLAKLVAYEGGNYRRLGDYRNAVRVLDTALIDLEPGMYRHRTTALIDRAEAHCAGGQLDAACIDVRAALTLLAATQHADAMNRAEKVARLAFRSKSREARQLWTEVIALKAATLAPPE